MNAVWSLTFLVLVCALYLRDSGLFAGAAKQMGSVDEEFNNAEEVVQTSVRSSRKGQLAPDVGRPTSFNIHVQYCQS